MSETGTFRSLGDLGESSWARIVELDCARYLELDGPPGRRVRQNIDRRVGCFYPNLRSTRRIVETHCSAAARQVRLLNTAPGHLETYESHRKSECGRSCILRWHCTFGSLNNLTDENSLNSPLPKYHISSNLHVLHGRRSTSSEKLSAWPVTCEMNVVV